MSILDKLFGKKNKKPDISSILPQEIFEAGVLELKDIIAPSALKVTPKEINLGEKILRSFFPPVRGIFFIKFSFFFFGDFR